MKALMTALFTCLLTTSLFAFNPAPNQVGFKAMAAAGANFTVGDSIDHNLNMGFISGSSNILVREKTSEGYFWLEQNMDLGFAGKQKMETLLDPATGEVKKFLVNGEEKEIPKNNTEVVSMEESEVTVPKGTFKAIYVVIKNLDDGKESKVWINPELIPVNGMLKMVAPGPMGDVTLELTDFEKK